MLARHLGLSLTLLVSSGLLLACNNGEEALAAKDAELAEARQALETAKSETEAKNASLNDFKTKVDELNAQIEAKDKSIAELEGAKGNLEGKLERQEEELARIESLSEALAKTLVEEMETGDIRVSQRGGYLVVDVSDKVLFAIGEAELSTRGQKVITKLAESLVALPEQSIFQVGGHTDNQPIKSDKVLERFPTNWELSAARATNVVRFLEETCNVPGERLVAAGFSEFRPVAKNSKPKGRAKNRRIEIALLPPRG